MSHDAPREEQIGKFVECWPTLGNDAKLRTVDVAGVRSLQEHRSVDANHVEFSGPMRRVNHHRQFFSRAQRLGRAVVGECWCEYRFECSRCNHCGNGAIDWNIEHNGGT